MRPFIVDLNDTAIRVARGIDELVQSPAYATLINHQIELGDAGYQHAWLHPRQSSNRFWHDLNSATLTRFGKRVRHNGDLAYLHLQSLRERAGRPTSALLLVPGAYQRPQLSLLLGIAQAAGLGVSALIDSAVASAAMLPPGTYSIAELMLHQTVLTRVEINTDQVERRHVEVIGIGLAHFEQHFLRVIVDAFLTRCRFDPLHDASTEQLLHSHLPAWLNLLSDQPEIILTIDFRGARHETRIQRDALASAVIALYQQIAERAVGTALVLDHRLARLPGAQQSARPVHLLDAAAGFTGCVVSPELAQATSTGGVSLRTVLKRAEHAPNTAITSPASAAPGATHLLARHTAYALSANPLYLTPRGAVQGTRGAEAVGAISRTAHGVQLEVFNTAQIALNGQLIRERCRVTVGDHITVPGAMALFVPIQVTTADAI